METGRQEFMQTDRQADRSPTEGPRAQKSIS
jgi:hypothetical protein